MRDPSEVSSSWDTGGAAEVPRVPASVRQLLASLRIPLELPGARGLELQPEATELVAADADADGRTFLLAPPAAAAWQAMKAAARDEGIALRAVSAFRSFERQAEMVRNKLRKGRTLDTILCLTAPPGYSEHHSGRAIDLTAEGARPLNSEFGDTPAFRWLGRRAARFGFALSFPRGNRHGFDYEPWHWCFRGGDPGLQEAVPTPEV